jgi:hypothetical protein
MELRPVRTFSLCTVVPRVVSGSDAPASHLGRFTPSQDWPYGDELPLADAVCADTQPVLSVDPTPAAVEVLARFGRCHSSGWVAMMR